MDAYHHQLRSSFIDGKSDDKNLELRLGPPGGDGSVYFLSYNSIPGGKRAYQATLETEVGLEECLPNIVKHKHPCQELSPMKRNDENVFWSLRGGSSFQREVLEVKSEVTTAYAHQKSQFMAKNNPQDIKSYGVDLQQQMKGNAFSCSAAVQKRSSKRVSPAPVVGWPPVGSYRKNLTSNSTSKQSPMPTSQIKEEKAGGEPEHVTEHMFIKVYMDGIPIGRKVNLKAYDSYEKLSIALDELFGGLLAAWRSGLGVEDDGSMNEEEADAADREYTLVYEDNEGDSILVGDVPWNMFVSTAKKLRLLKSSNRSPRQLTSLDEKKTFLDPAAENG